MHPLESGSDHILELDPEQFVDRHYASLYRFALSLAQSAADAGDLTQQTFLT